MTILSSVMQFAMLPLQGLTQGAQPITGYNFGVGSIKRVKKTFFLLLAVCVSYSTLLWGASMLFPPFIASLFTSDTLLIDFASKALRIYMATSLLFGIQIACQQTFISLGNAKISMFLAIFRKIIVLIPLIYILPLFLPNKTVAVYTAEPVADFIAVSVTSIMFSRQFKKLGK